MKPAPFEYHAPEGLTAALRILQDAGDDGKVLAGGQSLMPLLNMRLARPAVLVDINRISELNYLHADADQLRVGALVRHSDLLRNGAVSSGWPLLAEAAAHVGHPAIRNRGTVCGSIAHADPAAELPGVLAALDGTVVAAGPGGRREIPVGEFFRFGLMTALAPEEIVVEVRFPKLPPGTGTCFMELSRRHGDFAIVGVAAALNLADGICQGARLALVGVGPMPLRAPAVEAMLQGEPLVGEAAAATLQAAARQVAALIDPDDDVHASAEYRRHLATVLVERALAKALERAGGTQVG